MDQNHRAVYFVEINILHGILLTMTRSERWLYRYDWCSL